MPEINGHAVDVEPVTQPFGQRGHDLMIGAIEQVTNDWIAQLREIRSHNERIEALIVEHVGKIRADLTQLFILGSGALTEARRGQAMQDQLASELLKLTEPPQQ